MEGRAQPETSYSVDNSLDNGIDRVVASLGVEEQGCRRRSSAAGLRDQRGRQYRFGPSTNPTNLRGGGPHLPLPDRIEHPPLL